MATLNLKGEILKRWPGWDSGKARRAQAALKLSIYGESYLPRLQQYIADVLGPKDPQVTKFIQRLATRSPNLLKAVTDTVAVSNQRGCMRELRGLGQDAAKAFAQLVDETGIDCLQNGIVTKSWLQGPVLCVGHFTSRGRVALSLTNSDSFDVEREGDDIEAAVFYSKGHFIEVDSFGFNYYDGDGNFTHTIPHGAKVCPAVAFTCVDNVDDWWSTNDHGGLLDATMKVGFMAASGAFTRWVAGTKLVTVFTDVKGSADGQDPSHPVVPLVLPLNAKVQVDDRIVNSSDYLNEISAVVSLAVQTEGIPPGSISMVSNQNEYGTIAISSEGGRLAILRDRQVAPLRRAEKRLWGKLCDMVRASPGHRLAKRLPSGDECEEALRVAYPDLSTSADALARIEVLKAGLPLGITSCAEFIASSRPELTREEIEEEMRDRLQVYIKQFEPLVHRNTPATPPSAEGYQTNMQQQGAEGGRASGESRRNAADAAANENGV